VLERPALAGARIVLALGAAGAAALPPQSAPAVVLPVPVPPYAGTGEDDPGLFTAYAPDPQAKGLDVLCGAWIQAALEGARLEVFGIEAERARAWLARRRMPEPAGVRWRGLVAQSEFRAALGRARAHVVGARWEDFGQAPLLSLIHI